MYSMSKIHYLAGIIDGEGSIALTRDSANSQFRFPTVVVTNTSRAIIDWLQENYGGMVVSQKKYKDHHKQAWIWSLRHRAALNLCIEVGPLLLDERKHYRATLIGSQYDEVTQRNGKYTSEQRTIKLQFEQEVMHGPFD